MDSQTATVFEEKTEIVPIASLRDFAERGLEQARSPELSPQFFRRDHRLGVKADYHLIRERQTAR